MDGFQRLWVYCFLLRVDFEDACAVYVVLLRGMLGLGIVPKGGLFGFLFGLLAMSMLGIFCGWV